MEMKQAHFSPEHDTSSEESERKNKQTNKNNHKKTPTNKTNPY